MANEIRIRDDGVAGAIDAALTTSTTTLSSPGLADLEVIGTTKHAPITLVARDTDGRVTAREVVWVTAHTASATTATILRAQEGTEAAAWAIGSKWVHGPTLRDFKGMPTVASKTASQAMTLTAATNVTDMALYLEALSAYYVCFAIPITTVSGTAPTIAFSFTGPAGSVMLTRRQMTSATAMAFSAIAAFATSFAAGAIVLNTLHIIEGIIVPTADGVVQLRAAMGGTLPSATIAVGASAYAIKVL